MPLTLLCTRRFSGWVVLDAQWLLARLLEEDTTAAEEEVLPQQLLAEAQLQGTCSWSEHLCISDEAEVRLLHMR